MLPLFIEPPSLIALHAAVLRRLAAWTGWVLAAILANSLGALSVAWADDYILGEQDSLKIRVFEWRSTTGTAFEWVPLTGEFVISPAGNLSLPIIGAIPAAGKTLEQVADLIGEKLQLQVGLQRRPNASVEVAAYRPFYVNGLVAQPGKYGFTPGLTVVQALSIAGGIAGMDTSLISLQRDALISKGNIRELAEERLGLLAKQARVDAILDSVGRVVFPMDLKSIETEPLVARMIKDQLALFDTQTGAMTSELDALAQARTLAINQIESLKAKAASLSRQIEFANKDVESVNKLIAQGLTISARELAANQNLAELEGRNIDVELATLRMQQDVAKLDQDKTDVRNRYRVAALTEAGDLRDRLAVNAEKTKTAKSLISNLEARAPAAISALMEDGNVAFTFRVDRKKNGTLTRITVRDNDLVEPGDVLTVERSRAAGTSGG